MSCDILGKKEEPQKYGALYLWLIIYTEGKGDEKPKSCDILGKQEESICT